VIGSSARLVVGGVAAGTAVAGAGARAIDAQLYGVTAADPVTCAAVMMSVAVTALFAT
jgi:hypothetical protein